MSDLNLKVSGVTVAYSNGHVSCSRRADYLRLVGVGRGAQAEVARRRAVPTGTLERQPQEAL